MYFISVDSQISGHEQRNGCIRENATKSAAGEEDDSIIADIQNLRGCYPDQSINRCLKVERILRLFYDLRRRCRFRYLMSKVTAAQKYSAAKLPETELSSTPLSKSLIQESKSAKF
jgi:hypothetical protein